jgi:hypothetical protein
MLKHGHDPRANADARAAMKWLDELTNMTNSAVGSRVCIEGSLQKYDSWSEVKAFMLPKDLLSVESNGNTAESASDDEESLTKNISDLYVDDEPDDCEAHSTPEPRPVEPASPVSTFTKYSPSLLSSSPFCEPQPKVLAPIGFGRPLHRKTDSNASSIITTSTARPSSRLQDEEDDDEEEEDEDDVSADLRPFFNHIMWRIKKDPTTDMGVDLYILLTNDLAKQAVAQRFGIRVMRLDQMRDLVVREDQDLKNRIAMQKREASQLTSLHKQPTLGFGNGSAVIADPPASPTIKKADSPAPTPVTPARSEQSKEEDTEDDDVILIKPKLNVAPPKAPQAMQSPQTPWQAPKSADGSAKRILVDPNSYARDTTAPRSPQLNNGGSTRGNNRARGWGSVRGNAANNTNGSTSGGRFGERPPSRGVYQVRRGQQGGSQQPHQNQQQQQQSPLDLSQPIDPNVFSRGSAGIARGPKETKVKRQLWEP